MKFETQYVDNSCGFHKYVDPKDNEVYLYTHLEPYFCNRWFPCFDQPNLKAPLKLTVVSPDPNWKVISTNTEEKNMHISDSYS